MTPSQTKQRSGLDKDGLVEAAERQIDERGWANLTMTDLAAAVGIKAPSLYSRIESLDSLRGELARRAMLQLGDVTRSAALGRSAEDGFRALSTAYRSFARRFPARYEALTAGGPYDEAFAQAGDYAGEALRAILRSFGLEGDVARRTEQVVWAATHGFVSLDLRGAFYPDMNTDDTFAMFLDAMVIVIESAALTVTPERELQRD